jgi:CMP-N,N'-diacetyllegionaminic acid synthase
MLSGRTFLAVVPARGGSKSVPRKNIRMLGKQPLLVYTLEQVAKVPQIDLAVVSTDHPEIAKVATVAGTGVIERPEELATDSAPTEWALLHALDMLESKGRAFDYVVVLEPTSPFRSPDTIKRCMQEIVASDAPSLMTVVETRRNLGRLEQNVFRPLNPAAPRRRQDREPFYVETSTVYVCRADHLRRTGSLVADNWLAVTVPEQEAIDINSELDFAIAEAFVAKAGGIVDDRSTCASPTVGDLIGQCR